MLTWKAVPQAVSIGCFLLLRAGPSAIAVNADLQGGGWGQLRLVCVCVCVCACGLRSLVLRMIYWLLAGGRECGATADDADLEGSCLQQLRIVFPARFGAQALRRTTLTRPSEPAALTGLYKGRRKPQF